MNGGGYPVIDFFFSFPHTSVDSMQKFFNAIFGDPNKKVVDALRRDVEKINALERQFTMLSDNELKGKTLEFRERLAKGETIDSLVLEAFAAVREAARRTLAQRHFDVQLMGGLVLFRGGIAEMRTGEGKTLTSTAPLYANALMGKGCHLVTVNDYLAKRDSVWMGQVFHRLGLSTGCIQHEGGFIYDPHFKHEHDSTEESGHDKERDETGSFRVHTDFLRPVTRKEAYACDITYGTNNEFGFDYLRDNMAQSAEACVMRGLAFAIVDEVDSILIDEARTPLIISAPAEQSNELYARFATITRMLVENTDYNIDEKMRAATFTEQGIAKVERAFGVENLYATDGRNLQHFAESALRAVALYKRDVNYVVKDGGVVIVDEFTGRLMPGRRFSEGIHQAIEAKEGLEVQRESLTLATITFQNFFRLYEKLGGMTGTAATEAEEFGKIYELEVTAIPTNRDVKRVDLPDRVYKNETGKFLAVVREIKERHEKGQPVLVGTVSIEKNEMLGELLKREGVPFNLLNAKNHEKEAEIIAQAGRIGAVTIATNMAGRGVDIKLGGVPTDESEAEKVRELGGLHVIGTERHESRRIDNQLRGRSGRQGDPGSTQFYVSMEDDLMRIFGSDRVKSMMDRLGIPDDMPIENSIITGSIEKAQQRVEGHHFDIRKHLLEYDDVLNKHREVVYKRRQEVLEAYASEDNEALSKAIVEIIEGEVEQVVLFHTAGVVGEHTSAQNGAVVSDTDAKEIVEVVKTIVPLKPEEEQSLKHVTTGEAKDKLKAAENRSMVIETIMNVVRERFTQARQVIPDPKQFKMFERSIMLRAMDTLWIEHLSAMTSLRTSIGLRSYGQRDPLIEYKKEAYGMFQRLLGFVNQEIAYNFFKQITHVANARAAQQAARKLVSQQQGGPDSTSPVVGGVAAPRPTSETPNPTPINPTSFKDVGRNDPCPCGSGKKFKKCHGA
jgi:preprotein translocase subunit SecA